MPTVAISFSRKLLPVSIVGALAVVLQSLSAAHAQPQDAARPASSNPRVRVTISKETTWITSPLRADGYPDYVRYLNEKLSEGVTPENNAIVPLVRTMGLLDVDDQVRDEYCKLLGIELPPKDGRYFESWWSFTSRTPEAEQPRVPPGDKRLQKDYFLGLVEEAASRPWTAEEFPHVGKWLKQNGQHLDDFLAASKRPRAYSPWVIAPDEDFEHPQLIAALLLDVDMVRDAAQALRCRAMLRATENDIRGAQGDLLAAQRLAVLLAPTPNLVHFLAAKDIECKTRLATIQLCAEGSLTRKQIEDLRGEWPTLPAIATLAKAIDIGERVQFLDATCYVAKNGWGALLDIVGLITDLSGDGEPRVKRDFRAEVGGAVLSWLVRWDEPLKLGNEWYDRLVQIVQMEDPDQQVVAVERFNNDLETLAGDFKKMPTPTGYYFYPRTIPTRSTSRILVVVMLSAVSAPIQSARYLEDYRSLFDVSMAVHQYRADHNDYPDSLQKLVPQYTDRLPSDVRRRAFVYRKTNAGFVLYSLGKNGRDDGGKEWSAEDKEADDVVIQLPVKNSRATKQ
jgi:hypothetical protein